VPLFQRVGLGTVLGYLTAGVIIGPSGLGLIQEVDDTLHIAEFGVVLLLFLIGLELQPARLWKLRRAVFGFGGAQVAATAAVLAAIGMALGLAAPAAIVVGLALSLSSTALVLQLLGERHELATTHGRAAFGILLFQDLAAIPLLAVVPLLGAVSPSDPAMAMPLRMALVVAVLAVIFVAGRFLLRPIFRIVAETRSRDLSVSWALLVVVATALAMQLAGLSMALGAFLAGMLLADSEYRHEAEANVEPFKGLLLGLFFIAVGMSADIGVVRAHPFTTLALALGLVAVKGLVLTLLGGRFGLRADGVRNLALALSQGGEFAFVIFAVARQAGVLAAELTQLLVVVVTLSMATTPALLAVNDWLGRRRRTELAPFDEIHGEDDTVIIAGFGRFGQIVSRVLTSKRIPTTALEIDATQIEVIRRFGHKVFYGDASRLELLRAAGAEHARLFVLAIDDVDASIRTAQVLRRNFPDLRIVARARNRQHTHALLRLGVHHVLRELYGSSLEATVRVLEEAGLSGEHARQAVRRFRQHDEALLYRQMAAGDDEAELMRLSRDAAAELEQILTADDRSVG
jgi:glutathione-regulated potassium-efflux system ancillary protein KefC/glutathione-regulated potassium-efflux system protein KefB